MSLLDHGSKMLEIDMYYKEVNGKDGSHIVILPLEDGKKKFEEKATKEENIEEKVVKAEKIFLLKTKWKILSWGEQTKITKMSTYFNHEQMVNDFDPWTFRDLRIKTCLVEWDMTDDKNTAIPVTPDNIDRLPGDVVLYLVSEYDKKTEISGEDEKN
ncbi:MAG: hypothetical protein WDA06_00190 [Phenylobacterium sp.]